MNITETDFKAEVMAAEMIENGVAADRILIMMLGATKRTFRKDVDSLAEEMSAYDHKDFYIIKKHQEGIYDMLPEGIFHEASLHKSAKTEKEIIESIKQQRLEERNARKFFLPFEAAINQLYIQMALYENVIDKRWQYNELADIFSGHWPVIQLLDFRQANIFLHILPLIHEIREDYPTIKIIFELIFLMPVQLTLQRGTLKNSPVPVISQLAGCRLGMDLTTGNEGYDDGLDELLITIGPMNSAQLRHFMPSGKNRRLLELLSDYFMPAHIDIVTEFKLVQADRLTRLATENDLLNCNLGTNTWL